jgi:hypothetical protein
VARSVRSSNCRSTTPVVKSSMPLSTPNVVKATERAAMPAQRATTSSITIQANVRASASRASRIKRLSAPTAPAILR